MDKYIKVLVENEDFTSIDEFKECLRNQKAEVLIYLQWRADNGTCKDEVLPVGYVNAVKNLLAMIWNM